MQTNITGARSVGGVVLSPASCQLAGSARSRCEVWAIVDRVKGQNDGLAAETVSTPPDQPRRALQVIDSSPVSRPQGCESWTQPCHRLKRSSNGESALHDTETTPWTHGSARIGLPSPQPSHSKRRAVSAHPSAARWSRQGTASRTALSQGRANAANPSMWRDKGKHAARRTQSNFADTHRPAHPTRRL